MINPSIILCLLTIAISIWAFRSEVIMRKLILSPYLVTHRKEWYRVITHAFIHADWAHLIFNMIALWSFGEAVLFFFSKITLLPELHFYLMYFLAIIVASIPDIIKHKNDASYLSLGASGGVSAVIFAAIFFDPWNMIFVFFIPCPGIIFGILYLVYSSYMSRKEGERINHSAHFYGSVCGLIYPLIIDPASINVFIYKLMHPQFF